MRGHGQIGMLDHCGADALEGEEMEAGRLARGPSQRPGEG